MVGVVWDCQIIPKMTKKRRVLSQRTINIVTGISMATMPVWIIWFMDSLLPHLNGAGLFSLLLMMAALMIGVMINIYFFIGLLYVLQYLRHGGTLGPRRS